MRKWSLFWSPLPDIRSSYRFESGSVDAFLCIFYRCFLRKFNIWLIKKLKFVFKIQNSVSVRAAKSHRSAAGPPDLGGFDVRAPESLTRCSRKWLTWKFANIMFRKYYVLFELLKNSRLRTSLLCLIFANADCTFKKIKKYLKNFISRHRKIGKFKNETKKTPISHSEFRKFRLQKSWKINFWLILATAFG